MVVYISSSFTKNHNSTRQADVSGFSSYPIVRLKEPCNIINPTIELSDFIPNACYAYIPAFNRYYFISDIESLSNSITRYTLAVDAMGTYRSNILGSSQYCTRSSAGNLALHDSLITHAEQAPNNSYQSIAMGISGESYVIEVVGKTGVALYSMTYNQLSNLLVNLFNEDIYEEESTGGTGGTGGTTAGNNSAIDATVKTYFNPFQYILGCKYFPFSIGGTPTSINFGWWDSGITANRISDPSLSTSWFSANFTVPTIDSSNNFWNKENAWIRHNLLIPGCGDIELPSDCSGEQLYVAVSVDVWTGQCNALVRYPGGATIARASGQLSADIRLSQLSADMSNIGTTMMLGSNAATGQNIVRETMQNPTKNFFSSMLGGLFNAVEGVLPGDPIKSSLAPNLSTTSATGNVRFLKEHRDCILSTTYYAPYNAESTRTKFNLMDNTYHSLSSLSGYTMCEAPKLDINCTNEERNIISNFMRGGFYIE